MIHRCEGCPTLPVMSRIWHGAFRRWYAADRAGHGVRAALWGRFADSIVDYA